MRLLLLLLWIAGSVQVAIASANLFLPAKLNYHGNLSRVPPIIRQIFVVHSVYIVGVVLLFAAATFGFPRDLASGRGLGRFLAAAIAVFDHLSHALYTFPIFGLVGMKEKQIRPLAVEDLVEVMLASFHDARLSNKTVSITGPEEITLREAVRRVGSVIGKHPLYVPTPLEIQKVIAWVAERTMKIPLLSLAQLRILSEGIVEALPPCDALPADLQPATGFVAEQIQHGLPPPGPFGLRDLRCCKG